MFFNDTLFELLGYFITDDSESFRAKLPAFISFLHLLRKGINLTLMRIIEDNEHNENNEEKYFPL